MAESGKRLQAAGVLNGDELGAVLASIGYDGGAKDRLAAVVALLSNGANETGQPVRGAFAGADRIAPDPMVRSAFTSALHGCLREQQVNAVSPANTSSR